MDFIELSGYTYEPTYECFSTAHSIRFNDELLFYKGSNNVEAYHNEEYTTGKFKTSEEAVNYLEEYLRDKEVTLQYEPPEEKELILRIIMKNDFSQTSLTLIVHILNVKEIFSN